MMENILKQAVSDSVAIGLAVLMSRTSSFGASLTS